MSRLNIILIGALGFGPVLLMGMKNKPMVNFPQSCVEARRGCFKDKYGDLLPQEIIDKIITDAFDVYTEEVFKSNVIWPFTNSSITFNDFYEVEVEHINSQERLDFFLGKRLDRKDIALICMDDERKQLFCNIISSIKQKDPTGQKDFIHIYNGIESITEVNFKRDGNIGQSLLTERQYADILKFSPTLRSKVGNLCTMQVMEKPKSADFSFEDYKIISSAGLCGATCGSLFDTIFNGSLKSLGYCVGIGTVSGITGSCLCLLKDKNNSREIKIVEKPLVPEKYEDIVKLKASADLKLKKLFTLSQRELTKSVKLNSINLKNIE